MKDERRLIEDFIPIKEISAESAREKSIRKGHISTLHLWWARRPLVASRAAVFASLVPAPENYQKRSAYKKQMIDLCQWKASEDTIKKAQKTILEAQRTRLGLPEDTPLSEVPPPKVLDMFAGGGAIPLEALRLGCETYAVDLNPVAHIIELCTLVYPQKYGQKLATEVEKWGNWVIEKVRAEIGDLYPGIDPHPLAPSPRGEGGQDGDRNISGFLPSALGRGIGGEGQLGVGSEDLSRLAGRQRQVLPELLERAKQLRRNQTPSEEILWECLRERRLGGAKFRRQHNIGSYIVDFYCHDARLVVEVDGPIHDGQQERDENRDRWLMQQGLQVVRFKNEETQESLDRVLNRILDYLNPDQNPQQISLFPDSTPLSSGRGAGGEGLTPVAYLWTRTVKCPNPACGADVPLARQTWLCKKSKKYVALKVIPNYETMQVDFQVVEAATEKELGFDPAAGSARGTSTCRHCAATVDVKRIKQEGTAGRIGQQLMAIVCTTGGEQGKTYLSGTDYQRYIPDEKAILERLDNLCQETGLTTPDEPLPSYGTLGFRVQPYGFLQWRDLFSPRQLLSLMTFVKWVRKAHDELLAQGYEEEFAKAIGAYLALAIGKVEDRCSALCIWAITHENIVSPVSNGRLPMNWDFPETNPIANTSGSWNSAFDYLLPALSQFCQIDNQLISLIRQSCFSLPHLETSSLDAIVTDPPYFDAVPYADLSDYFYVWFKRSLGHLYPQHLTAKLTPKKQEATMEPSRHGGDKKLAAQAYEDMMHDAFQEANRVLKDGGLMCVVYAHKTTMGWSTLIDSLRRAKFTITEAWPLDTERPSGLRILRASLASSIFLISRKRTTSIIGDYSSDVQPQLKTIIQNRVKTLMEEGVSGADLVIACVGAGLRAYTQFDSVELPNGDELDAASFLSEVQKEVAETILREVLGCDSKGVSQIDKATQYYILARYEYGEAEVEFDEANTLAKGVGVELDGPNGLTDGKTALVAKTKNTVKLRNYQDRGQLEGLGVREQESGQRQEFNVPSPKSQSPTPLIDILHRLLWLTQNKAGAVSEYIAQAQPDASQLKLVAQALAGRALTDTATREETNSPSTLGKGAGSEGRSPEQQAIDTLLASWKRTIEENLFTR